jgi:hypothetical protein
MHSLNDFIANENFRIKKKYFKKVQFEPKIHTYENSSNGHVKRK